MGYVTPPFKMTRAMLCSDGRTVLIWFSNPATIGDGGSGGFALYDGATLVSNLSYLAGDAGIVFVLRADTWFEPMAGLKLSYVQPGNGVETGAGADLPTSDIGVFEEYAAPTAPILAPSIDATGRVLTLVFDRPMTQGTGYVDTDFNLDGSIAGADIGVMYTSGDGTTTHVYAITTAIQLGEVVNLDYNGRAGGMEDSGGSDLGAILNLAVANNSTEEYADIVFWDGFEGTLTGTTYESTNYDLPAFHTATFGAGVTLNQGVFKVGAESMRTAVSSGGPNTTFVLSTPVAKDSGRVGFWSYGACNNYGILMCLREAGTNNLLMLQNATNPSGNLLLSRRVITTYDPLQAGITTPTTRINTWVFLEVAWNRYTFGTKVLMDGQATSLTSTTPTREWTGTYDRLIIGPLPTDVFGGGWDISAITTYTDNIMISTDPDRDLYALALLEAYPGA